MSLLVDAVEILEEEFWKIAHWITCASNHTGGIRSGTYQGTNTFFLRIGDQQHEVAKTDGEVFWVNADLLKMFREEINLKYVIDLTDTMPLVPDVKAIFRSKVFNRPDDPTMPYLLRVEMASEVKEDSFTYVILLRGATLAAIEEVIVRNGLREHPYVERLALLTVTGPEGEIERIEPRTAYGLMILAQRRYYRQQKH